MPATLPNIGKQVPIIRVPQDELTLEEMLAANRGATPRPPMQNVNEDMAKYGTIGLAQGGQSSMQQFLHSLLGNIIPSFTGGEHPVSGTEGIPGPAEFGRNTAAVIPAIASAAGGLTSKAGQIPLALRALSRMHSVPQMAGVLGTGGATAALVGGGQPGLPASNHELVQPTQPVQQLSGPPYAGPQETATSQQNIYIPEELQAMIGQSQLEGDDGRDDPYNHQYTSEQEQQPMLNPVSAEPVAYAAQSSPQSEQPQPAQAGDEAIWNQIQASLASRPLQAPQESFDPESTEAYKDLTKPRDVGEKAPTSTLGKFGRGVSKFVTNMSAPGGSYDPTRYDSLQTELADKKRQFTPQEALRGQTAGLDIQGTRQFNRQAQLEQQKTGGLTDRERQQTALSVGGAERSANRQSQKDLKDLELRNDMAKMAGSAAMQRMTPEAQRAKNVDDIFAHHPELLTSEIIAQTTGLAIPQERLDQLMASKADPMKGVLALLMAPYVQQASQRAAQTTKSGKTTKNGAQLTTQALGAKQ